MGSVVNGKRDVAYLIAILIVIFAWLLMTYLLTHKASCLEASIHRLAFFEY